MVRRWIQDSSELSSSLLTARVNLQKLAELYGQLYYHSAAAMIPLYRCWRPTRRLFTRKYLPRLLVAAQAVPRHQEETYRQALDNVSDRFALITIPTPRQKPSPRGGR